MALFSLALATSTVFMAKKFCKFLHDTWAASIAAQLAEFLLYRFF